MFLCNDSIRDLCTDKEEPLIAPFDERQLQPASYDVRLGSVFFLPPELSFIDTRRPLPKAYTRVEAHGRFHLKAGQFVLATIEEWVNIPLWLRCSIEGKSTNARLGWQVHSAGYVDPGFKGNLTLEIVNHSQSVLYIYPGDLVAQLAFAKLDGEASKSYGECGNKYQNQNGVVGAILGGER